MTTSLGPERRGDRRAYAGWLVACAVAAWLWLAMATTAAGAAEAPTNAPPKAAAGATNAAPAKTTGPAANAPAKAAPAAKADESEAKDKGAAKETETGKDKEAKEKEGEKEGAKEAAGALTPEQMYEGGAGTYKNWVEVTGGGMMVRGDAAQAAQQQSIKRGAFGGIEDLHVEGNIDKKTTIAVDGHGIFDNHDYQLSINVKREDTGYLKLSFDNFRTYSDVSGGFFAPGNLHFSTFGEGLPLDWGKIAFEAGLRPKDGPKVTFRYTHRYREGDDSSTIWGPVNTSAGTRGIYPSSYYIDEHSDAFELDVAHKIGPVEFGGGLRYEVGSLDNSLLTTSQPGGIDQQEITDKQGTDYDLFSVHTFAQTWLKKDLFLSSGFVFDNLDSKYTGSQVYGDDFNVVFTPNPLAGLGYYDLSGGSHMHEYVWNLNLLATPAKAWAIVPSVRVDKEDWAADSGGIGTLDAFPTQGFSGHSGLDQIDVTERVDLRYTGVTNWVFYAGPQWTEGSGDLGQFGGLTQVAGIGFPTNAFYEGESRIFQKYQLGARWYPSGRLTVDAGGYYKFNSYDYDFRLDNTPNGPGSGNRYPGFLVMQNFETYDGNARLTVRPFRNVTLVGRYEYQLSNVRTEPDPASGLSETDSARMTSHIIGFNASWVPWSRLSLQLGFNYVLSDLVSPVIDYTTSVLKAENDYWTMNFNSGLVVDNKTDLNLGFFYYQPDNLQNNYAAGLPVGAAAQEFGVTASLTRRISEHVRLNIRYAFTHLEDFTSGGFNNFEAHLVSTSLQYRF